MPKVITCFEVKDYAHWKRTFDGHAGKREKQILKLYMLVMN